MEPSLRRSAWRTGLVEPARRPERRSSLAPSPVRPRAWASPRIRTSLLSRWNRNPSLPPHVCKRPGRCRSLAFFAWGVPVARGAGGFCNCRSLRGLANCPGNRGGDAPGNLDARGVAESTGGSGCHDRALTAGPAAGPSTARSPPRSSSTVRGHLRPWGPSSSTSGPSATRPQPRRAGRLRRSGRAFS